jgi:hypothetical protein
MVVSVLAGILGDYFGGLFGDDKDTYCVNMYYSRLDFRFIGMD